MKKDFSQFDNLGSPKIFIELFRKVNNSSTEWFVNNIHDYFYNQIIDNCRIFDGCLPLLSAIEALKVDKKNQITLNPKLTALLSSEVNFTRKMLELILDFLKEEDSFYEIFNQKFLTYDVINKLIQIDNSAFQFKYANIRDLLIRFGLLSSYHDVNIRKLAVNEMYRSMFTTMLLPRIKDTTLTMEGLRNQLELNMIYGNEAEVFVVNYEKRRLKNHGKIKEVERISEYDVSAGYDILSFENISSRAHDRFIEVKSYSDKPSFHWSSNEINVARIRGNQYYLYLVNRDRIKDDNYAPYIIRNPHDTVFIKSDGDWIKYVKGYYITKEQ